MFPTLDTHTGASTHRYLTGPALLPSRSTRFGPLRRILAFCVLSLALAALVGCSASPTGPAPGVDDPVPVGPPADFPVQPPDVEPKPADPPPIQG